MIPSTQAVANRPGDSGGENSSRAKTTVMQYHDASVNASASAGSASDANQNSGVDKDLMGDRSPRADGKFDDTIGSVAQNLLLSDLVIAPGQWHRALGEVRSVLTRSLDITELPDPKKQKVFEPETEQMEQLLATLQRME